MMKYLFYRPIKIPSDEANVYFWSDTHFNHVCANWPIPLWRARGFSSLEEHNEGLIERWNERCNDQTTFFHLGDFIFGLDSALFFKSIIERLRFKSLYVMPGNHYSGWKHVFEQQKSNVWDVSKGKRVIFIPNYAEVLINEQLIVLSHYPILSFNGQSKHSICIYGHVHGNLIKNQIGVLYAQARTYEVTVENSPYPTNLVEIKQSLVGRQTTVFDSHL